MLRAAGSSVGSSRALCVYGPVGVIALLWQANCSFVSTQGAGSTTHHHARAQQRE